MNERAATAFLEFFFEAVQATKKNVLGTETFTKAREDADADRWANNPDAAALGTETQTASREDADSDVSARQADSYAGTQTFTEVRSESPDSDDARVGPLWETSIL